MPDEIEVPLDQSEDDIAEAHEHAHKHDDEKESPETGWIRFVAVVTAIFAVVAAIGALQSGLLVNESLLEKNNQIGKLTQASDVWNYYQAEGLKALIYTTSAQVLPKTSPDSAKDTAEAAKYKDKQKALSDQATGLDKDADGDAKKSEEFLHKHHIFAFSVSFCQIAIALSAVAALTKRKALWIVGVLTGCVGTVCLIVGFIIG